MSLVGPRPCLPSQTELIEQRDHHGLWSLRPGITGPGQLSGLDMSEPVSLAEADAAYLDTSGIGVDVGYILRTVTGSGRGDAVGP